MGALKLSDDKLVMPSRPGYGTEGTAFVVYANYVQLIPPRDLTLYVYDISQISPEIKGKKCIQLIRLMINEAEELASYRNDIVTDFRSTLISRKKLALKAEGPDANVVTVIYKAEGEDDPKERAPQYKIKVQHTKILTVGELMDFLTSTNPANFYENKLDMIREYLPNTLALFQTHYCESWHTRLTNNRGTQHLPQALCQIYQQLGHSWG